MTDNTTLQETEHRLQQSGLVAIVRGQFTLDQLFSIGETLVAAGVPVLEVTLNTTNALMAIEKLRERLGADATLGAGTVRRREQLRQVIDAGAQFSVAPNFDAETVELAVQRHFLHLPGIFTPTEAENAYRAGCRVLKLFPSDVVGPAYLKALRAPLDDVKFVPTGGISAQNVGDYRRAGAVACGIGSALVTSAEQSIEDLAARARRLRQAWETAA